MSTSLSVRTPLQAFAQTVSRNPDASAMVQPLGDGQLRTYSWRQMQDQALRVAACLRELAPTPGSHIALISKNCAEWLIADLAIWLAGHVSVPLFPTLTAGTARQILEHSDSHIVFVGKLDNWEEIHGGISDQFQTIAFSLAPAAARASSLRWDDILQQYPPLIDAADPTYDALATIIYTSGTTGVPKGVMHDFRCLSEVGSRLAAVYELTDADRLISYLPLSHVLERAAIELSALYVGQTLYFVESVAQFADDLRRARPTLFIAVPRIWKKFHQRVSDVISPQRLRLLLRVPLLKHIVVKRLRSALGLTCCRVALSGAAPLSPQLIEWFRDLGIEILEGYGLTENFAWSHTTRRGEQRIGWVGRPNEGVECRIGTGGEILVKSVGNMVGYYREPELTAAAFDSPGWLKTGDLGEIDAEGCLRITGRMKDIFKTEKGKYVAPAPIENLLIAHPHIEQACVIGPGLHQPIALLSLSEEYIPVGVRSEQLLDELNHLLSQVNKTLDAHERLQAMVVVNDVWSIENDLLTPTLKLKRNRLEQFYAGDIQQWARRQGVFLAREPR